MIWLLFGGVYVFGGMASMFVSMPYIIDEFRPETPGEYAEATMLGVMVAMIWPFALVGALCWVLFAEIGRRFDTRKEDVRS